MKIAGYNSAAGWVAGVVGVHPWQADLFIAASGPEAEDRWLSRAIGADGRALQDFRDRLEFATADQARLFLSGDAAALGAGRAAIDAGFAAAYGTFFVLMALGTAATLVRPRRRP